jgi:hypothetical protein
LEQVEAGRLVYDVEPVAELAWAGYLVGQWFDWVGWLDLFIDNRNCTEPLRSDRVVHDVYRIMRPHPIV